jgi:hypothetical protein
MNLMTEASPKSKKWFYLASAVFVAWVGFLLFMALTTSSKPPEKKAGLLTIGHSRAIG